MIIGVGTKMRVTGVEDGYVRIVKIVLSSNSEKKWHTSLDLELNRQGFPSSITQVTANEITRGISKGIYTVIEDRSN